MVRGAGEAYGQADKDCSIEISHWDLTTGLQHREGAMIRQERYSVEIEIDSVGGRQRSLTTGLQHRAGVDGRAREIHRRDRDRECRGKTTWPNRSGVTGSAVGGRAGVGEGWLKLVAGWCGCGIILGSERRAGRGVCWAEISMRQRDIMSRGGREGGTRLKW